MKTFTSFASLLLTLEFLAVGRCSANPSFETSPVLTGETAEASGVVPSYSRPAWWSWTAPSTGQVTVDTLGSTFDSWLGIYVGDDPSSLDPVASNDNAVGRTSSEVTFQATANSTYRIAVYGAGLGQSGPAQVHLTLRRNEGLESVVGADDFLTRRELKGGRALGLANNERAGRQSSEPPSGGGENTVWWTWTAPEDGAVTIDTTGSESDTILKVYGGDRLDALSPIRWNNDANGELSSLVSFSAKRGVAYQICVDQAPFIGVSGGNVILNLALVPSGHAGGVVGTDNFNRRLTLEGTDALGVGNVDWATTQPGEPNLGEGNTLWWTWKALADGPVALSTAGSEFKTALAVYQGEQVDQLRLIADNDDHTATDTTSKVQFVAQRGAMYQIAVSRKYSLGARTIGNVSLALRQDAQLSADIEVVIEPAVRLAFFARAGVRYRLQHSPDLRSWSDLAEPILGEDQDREWFLPQHDVGKGFFRVRQLSQPVAGE